MSTKKNKSFYRYWGKTSSSNKYHLLPYHNLDVAAVGFYLISNESLWGPRLMKDLGLSKDQLIWLFVFYLALHDIGKFATSFQGLRKGMSPDLVEAEFGFPYTERHDSLGFFLWQKKIKYQFQEVELIQNFMFSKKSLRTLEIGMQIVMGHHGIPPKTDLQAIKSYFKEEDMCAAMQYVQEISTMFLPKIKNILEILENVEFKTKFKTYSWILSGITVLADWLGSSLPEGSYVSEVLSLEEYWEKRALPFAENAIKNINFSFSNPSPFSGIRNLFPFISKPTPLQKWAETIPIEKEPSFFILEDRTGSGKSEAAITLAHRILNKGSAKGIYIALPTKTTSDAMYDRMKKPYRRMFSNEHLPSLILSHGSKHLSSSFQQSVGLEYIKGNTEYDKELSGEAYCNAWFSDNGKKAMLADVGIGTIDQAIIGILPARHQSLRLLGLSNKVLIVDEVHSYNPYMNKLLQILLEAHATYGGSVILLSATLHKSMKQDYISAYCRGLDNREIPILAKEQPFPTATQLSKNIYIEEEISVLEDAKIKSTKIEFIYDESTVLKIIENSRKAGKCICWIRNTVSDAKKSYDKVKDKAQIPTEDILLFHSRFAMQDRINIEKTTLFSFGKKSTEKERKGKVLIATQVVEQSLDLDFDVIISDLAPIDLLMQRKGRQYRHPRDCKGNIIKEQGAEDMRPDPIFYVFSPPPTNNPKKDWLSANFPGTQCVYSNVGQLWLTQKILLEKKSINPCNTRELIESVYSDEIQNNIPNNLQHFSWKASGESSSEQSLANINGITNLHKGYARNSIWSSDSWNAEVNIATRLSDKHIDVVLMKEIDGKLIPYANAEEFSYDMSSLQILEKDWNKIKEKIPKIYEEQIEYIKSSDKFFKWKEIIPLTGAIQKCYSPNNGWSIPYGF